MERPEYSQQPKRSGVFHAPLEHIGGLFSQEEHADRYNPATAIWDVVIVSLLGVVSKLLAPLRGTLAQYDSISFDGEFWQHISDEISMQFPRTPEARLAQATFGKITYRLRDGQYTAQGVFARIPQDAIEYNYLDQYYPVKDLAVFPTHYNAKSMVDFDNMLDSGNAACSSSP